MTDIYDDDVFASTSSRFHSKKGPQRKLNGRASSASLRGSSLADSFGADAANGMSSLAFELAAALVAEGDSGGSRGLAEELGLEYDEGAEGIDESAAAPQTPPGEHELPAAHDSLAAALNGVAHEPPPDSPRESDEGALDDLDPAFETPTRPQRKTKVPEQDPMTTLSEDLESTERFITQLRRLDVEPSGRPGLESLASDVIRRIDDTATEREGQVRELLEYEREFRRIAGEVGGNDVLGEIDELDDLIAEPAQDQPAQPDRNSRSLDAIQEEPHTPLHASNSDWEAELDRDRARLGDEIDDYDAPTQQDTRNVIPAPPPISGPPTPRAATVQLAHFRTVTTTIASSLATLSEQTQVNTANATEAGRKIRALKNKLGEWRAEWESAERSRARVEKWEAGVMDAGDGTLVVLSVPSTPTRSGGRSRVDGRKIVEAQKKAFELALQDATLRVQTIMAALP